MLVQIFRSSHLTKLAQKQQNHYIKLDPKRGTIYDRKNRPLAINVSVDSLYANPKLMSQEDKNEAIEKLSFLINMNPEFIRQRLSRDKYFVWLQRKMPRDMSDRIKSLKIDGLAFLKESKRYYPNQFLAAHVIGFSGMDNEGLDGIELKYDKYLKGEFGWAQVIRDARQRELLIEKSFFPPRDGFNVILTIDETIQFLAEKALEEAFKTHNAKGASIIVMNPKTGEILALANRPTYNLAEVSSSLVETRTNRALTYMYEPGSVFKIVTASAALEEGVITETDKVFCENGTYKISSHVLHDHHPHGTLTFREVIEQSSNIGTVKVAQKLGAQRLYKYAQRFQFGKPTGITLSGEAQGVLKPPAQWSKISIAAIPIGHEVLTTPLQLVCAISAIANDGVYMKPFIVKYIEDTKNQIIEHYEPQVVDRVITESTAKRIQEILAGAVEKGTGKRAQVKGVTVAGKTGTAQKIIGGQYSHNKFYASFIGFAPVEDPKLAVVVVFDEPHPSYFGGTVAAPVFQKVVEDALKYLEANE